MVSNGGGVIVCDGQSALLVDQIADEWRVEDEILRTDFVAGHAFGEGGYFGGGEGGVPDADFGNEAVHSVCGGSGVCGYLRSR